MCVPAESEVPGMGTRRRFMPEYRRDVASLVLDTGSTIVSVARDLGLGESVVGRWVKLERERRQAVCEGCPDPRETLLCVGGCARWRRRTSFWEKPVPSSRRGTTTPAL